MAVLKKLSGVCATLALILSCFLPVTGYANDGLTLQGAAKYEELNKGYYVAGFFNSKPDREAGDRAVAQKLVIRVLARRWSPRKWQEQWRNNIAINNEAASPSDPAPDLSPSISRFTDFPRDNFRPGDEIVIEYNPASGTRVLANDQQIIQENGHTLFRNILNTWIGKLPPSRSFRDSITGVVAIDAGLRSELVKSVSEDRKTEVASWLYAEQEEKQVALQKRDELLLAREQAEAEREEEARLDAEEKKQEQARRKKAAADKKRKAAEKKAAGSRKASQAAKEKERKKKASRQAAARQKATKERHAKEAQRYWKDYYQWQMQNFVYENVSYPPWAKQFSQQGEVLLSFTVDRAGQATAINNLSPGVSDILVQEVTKRLKSGLSQLKPPADLKGDSWEFSAEYRFSLRGGPGDQPAAPAKPSFMK